MQELISFVISASDIPLLCTFWKYSFTTTGGEKIRDQITENLETIAKNNGLSETVSFAKLIREYDMRNYSYLCKDNHNKCLIKFVESGDIVNIKIAIEKGAENWPGALVAASTAGNLKLVKFFLKKIQENESWVLRTGVEFARRGRDFSSVRDIWDQAIPIAIMEASQNGHREIVQYLSNL